MGYISLTFINNNDNNNNNNINLIIFNLINLPTSLFCFSLFCHEEFRSLFLSRLCNEYGGESNKFQLYFISLF